MDSSSSVSLDDVMPPPANALSPPTLSPSEARALQRMTDCLAHRLRSVISGIEGYTDLLADTLGTAKQRELALRILEGTARLDAVVRDLRRFSTPICPVIRPVRVEAFLATLQQALGEARWARVQLDQQAAASDRVMADPVLLRQAVGALLQNAHEASPEGSVALTVEVAADGRATFEVWNDTPIPEADPLDTVFEPFVSTKVGRLGMGLPLARRIAAAHDGHLALVASTEQDGTRFALMLPARAEPVKGPGPAADGSSLPPSP